MRISLMFLVVAFELCCAGPCDIYASIGEDSTDSGIRGKGLNSHASLDWFQKLAIKPPKFSYDVRDACNNGVDMWLAESFGDEVQWFLDTFDEYNITDANFLGPSTYVCSVSEDDIDYTKNTSCPANGSFVSTPYYTIDYLQYWLPWDACPEWHNCKFVNDTECLCYGWMNSTLASINSTGKFREELQKQQEIAKQNYTISSYRRIHDYLGIGYNISQECRASVNTALDGVDDVDQAGWQAATTLSALVPALLTIGNLFVPRSSEAFATSFIIGLLSAFFSLGLPVRSISGISGSQTFDVASFAFQARHWIANIGKVEKRDQDGRHNAAMLPVKISELQRYSIRYDDSRPQAGGLQDEQTQSDLSFSIISHNVQQWSSRVYYFLPSFVLAATQVIVFLLGIAPLYFAEGTPFLLFDCRNYWTSTWITLAATVSAIFRFLMWERSSHERVKLYAMNDYTIDRFRAFVAHNSSTYSVETTLPPLYPRVLGSLQTTVFKAWYACLTRVGRSTSLAGTKSGAVAEPRAFNVLKHGIRCSWHTCVNIIRHPIQFFQAALWPFGMPPDSGRRWRPLYLLMHLSTNGRNPLSTLFTGLVEGFILILLTIFFAAQWGGNLFIMSYTLALLLLYITIGRALGLVHVQLASKFYGLHVIEAHDRAQIRGCLRIICAMQETLVHTNDAWYFEGHRLDVCRDWAKFQQCYYLGHMDGAKGSRRCNCITGAQGSSAQLLPTSSMTQLPASVAPQQKPVTSTATSSANRSSTSQSSTQNPV